MLLFVGVGVGEGLRQQLPPRVAGGQEDAGRVVDGGGRGRRVEHDVVGGGGGAGGDGAG